MRRHLTVLLTCALAGPFGCAPRESSPRDVPLRAVETFDWSGQPIAFAAPPHGWERQRDQSGGVEGVRFVKAGSVGEEVHAVEHFTVGNRDRCARLREIARDLDNMDRRTFDRALHRVRLYAEPPIHAAEPGLANAANDRLDRARRAFARDRRSEARGEVLAALETAGRIRYALDDVVERALYDPQGLPSWVRAEVDAPVAADLNGRPALRQDYGLHYSGRDYVGRRVYVVVNNRLFEIGFQGLAENLPLFARILETVSFPPGICEHEP